MRGRFFVLPDIYLSEAEQERRCGSKERSPSPLKATWDSAIDFHFNNLTSDPRIGCDVPWLATHSQPCADVRTEELQALCALLAAPVEIVVSLNKSPIKGD
ncbi:hypothetical protein EXN66_Car005010 [Channa argus]|uniref:Uncharacterized protein n=1 Tax=Channa argus TaxID=215402 RepID=A0A6G1PH59_CHAAH|nr:hypothetical protein EXN66_Car005010 [Channa argus]